jgi:hypothetical protein
VRHLEITDPGKEREVYIYSHRKEQLTAVQETILRMDFLEGIR